MALEAFMLPIIVDIAKDLPNRNVLCLGYPDMLALAGNYEDCPDARDAASIAKWHNWPGRVIDTDAFFARLGLLPTYVDRAKIRGDEIVMDLNEAEFGWDFFGLIIDPGTSEHIWNAGHLFKEIAGAVGVGGCVIHTNPLNQANHGFWSINPTAYYDFYEANGFVVHRCLELSGPPANRCWRDSSTERFEARQNSANFVLVQKIRDVNFVWPCQRKYRENPTLKGAT